MTNINELLKEYEKENDLLYRIEDYTHCESSYICDIINEIADSETDIYYSSLIDWLKNDPDSVDSIEEAVDEFGQPEHFDFMRLLQQGQCHQNEQKLYKSLDTIGKIWLLSYLRDKEGWTELCSDHYDWIENMTVDSNDTFEKLLDDFNDEFGK